MDPRRTLLPSMNTLTCSEVEILSMCLKYKFQPHCAESLMRDNILQLV